MGLSATCQCGAVQVALENAPEFINDCNCSLCSRAKANWGYFNPSKVTVNGVTSIYVRPDRETPAVEIHACQSCNITTHWVLTHAYQEQHGGNPQMGVNMFLFPQEDLPGVEIRFPDGAAWSGEGPYRFRRDSYVIGLVDES